MKQLVDTKEAARILNIDTRTVRRWAEAGRLECQFVNGEKGGGKSGQKLFVWIEDPDGVQSQTPQGKDRYKIHRGEPGCRVVTPLINGEPVLDPEPAIINMDAVSSSSSPPPPTLEEFRRPNPPCEASPPSQGTLLPVAPQSRDSNPALEETAYLRLAIINIVREEIAKNHKPRTEIIRNILELYNRGAILPHIYNDIGRVSRSTFYSWDSSERSGGVKALIPCYGGPRGSEITEQEKYILLNALLHQNRLKIGTAIKFTKTFLEYRKTPSPSSESKLRRFVDDFKKTRYDVWVEAREGAKALNDKCLPYAERDWRLLTVGEGLVADGHRLNFQVINPFTGKPCRATIVLFWDWKSSYPLGWEIMIEENIQCIASALRNAILTLGKIPKWLLIDNGKAFKAKCFTSETELEDGILYGMFATLGIHTHFAQAYNAQEKPLERFWGTFNNWFERLLPSYTGASIGDKPAYMMRNEKDAQARHNKWIPKIEEVSDILFRWREFYAEQSSRGRDNQTPGEIFQKEKGPGVDPNELAYLMMSKEIKSVGRNGVTWNGWHYNNDALYGFRDRVIVRFSHSDYSELYVFTLKNEFLCVAKPIEKVHPMVSEADAPADREALKRTIATKRRLRRQTLELHEMLDEKAADALPWKKIINKDPNVIETIEKKEAEKPRAKTNSAFVEEEINAKCEARYAESANRDKNAIVIDLRTGLSRPADGTVHEDQWEKYDWYMTVKKENPGRLNNLDYGWISEYEATDQWRRIYASHAIGGER